MNRTQITQEIIESLKKSEPRLYEALALLVENRMPKRAITAFVNRRVNKRLCPTLHSTCLLAIEHLQAEKKTSRVIEGIVIGPQ